MRHAVATRHARAWRQPGTTITAGQDDGIDWARVEALFPDLLDTPSEQRARFLDKYCKDAPTLRRELEAMLASTERATCSTGSAARSGARGTGEGFVLSVFREDDPLARENAASRKPAQLVDDGIRALNQRLADDPELRSELLDDLGEIQGNLGDLQGAQRTLQQALAQRTQRHGADSLAA